MDYISRAQSARAQFWADMLSKMVAAMGTLSGLYLAWGDKLPLRAPAAGRRLTGGSTIPRIERTPLGNLRP